MRCHVVRTKSIQASWRPKNLGPFRRAQRSNYSQLERDNLVGVARYGKECPAFNVGHLADLWTRVHLRWLRRGCWPKLHIHYTLVAVLIRLLFGSSYMEIETAQSLCIWPHLLLHTFLLSIYFFAAVLWTFPDPLISSSSSANLKEIKEQHSRTSFNIYNFTIYSSLSSVL